jgi:hypothetical protein
MPRAVLQSLDAAWRADIDLLSLPGEVPRFADLHLLETRIREQLPPSRRLPRNLRDDAMARVSLAKLLLGQVTLSGIVEVDVVWRPFLNAIAQHTEVTWDLPVHAEHSWFKGVTSRRETACNRKRSRSGRRHDEQTACRSRSACDSSAHSKHDQVAGAQPRRRRSVHDPRSYGRARHHRSDARLCGLRRHRLEADRRLRSPRLADIGECVALSCLHRIGGQHSRESDQRCSRSAVGIHPRLHACTKPASPFGGSRRGFPPVNCRDLILGLTELPSLGSRSGANGSSLY